MTDNMVRALSRVLAGLLLTAAFAIGASAQGPPSPPAASAPAEGPPSQPAASAPGGIQTLNGKIRWPKSLGVPNDSPCSVFYVAVLDPEKNSKLVWFDNNLQPSRNLEPDYYSCTYRINLPAGRRLLVVPGMGDSDSMFSLPQRVNEGNSVDDGSSVSGTHGEEHWSGAAKGDAGNDDPDWHKVPGFSRRRAFLPSQMVVTLNLKQGAYLKFELNWTLSKMKLPSRIM